MSTFSAVLAGWKQRISDVAGNDFYGCDRHHSFLIERKLTAEMSEYFANEQAAALKVSPNQIKVSESYASDFLGALYLENTTPSQQNLKSRLNAVFSRGSIGQWRIEECEGRPSILHLEKAPASKAFLHPNALKIQQHQFQGLRVA